MNPSAALSDYLDLYAGGRCFCVAYSGGADSHLLLALLVQESRIRPSLQVRAIHVDHGLHPESELWAEHAKEICEALDVALEVVCCDIDADGDSPEAAARAARYRAFAEHMADGEHLLLAQHADDQAETFLLQALRGAGPDGLSGMAYKRAFSRGFMARPLLFCTQAAVLEEAQALSLQWMDDPSNEEVRFDRNYLRLQVMPLLQARWPAMAHTLSRAAMRCHSASESLQGLASQDLSSVRQPGAAELSVSALKALPRERAFRAIRQWVRERGLRMPRLQDLLQVYHNLIHARHESSGLVNVREYVFRRYRDRLYLLQPEHQAPPFRYQWSAPYKNLLIIETGMVLTRDDCERQGIDLPEEGTVVVRSRTGGELIAQGQPVYHKAVKKILQESSVPPWQRDAIPLLFIDDKLVAVWQLAVATDHRHAFLKRETDSVTEPAAADYVAEDS